MKENYPESYAWVPWFQALAGKIDEGGEEYLIARAKRVKWGNNDDPDDSHKRVERGTDTPALLRYGDKNIDPFSFFYFLAQKDTAHQRECVYKSVSKVFDIDVQKRENLLSRQNLKDRFIPVKLNSQGLALFHDGVNGNPDLLWRLFRQAVKRDVEIDPVNFAKTIKMKNVGIVNLTQCLFLINPHYFMPINKVTLASHGGYDLPAYKDARRGIEQPKGWEYYKETMLTGFHAAFPNKKNYEINTILYLGEKPPKDNKIKNNLMNHPLNQILYGPPGTGKTWNTVNHALAIIEGKSVKEIEKEDRKVLKKRFDELKDGRQIEMVTFHQNFSYEDFIEGIRPILGDAAGNDSGDESSNLQYEIVDGVFKRIADRAHENLIQSESNSTGLNLDALLEAYADHIEERLVEGEEIKYRISNSNIDKKMSAVNRKNNGKLRSITVRSTTGAKWRYRLARKIIKRDYADFCKGEIKSPHGIRPSWNPSLKKHSESKHYFALCGEIKKFHATWNPEEGQSKQQDDEIRNYVLIIDEINRGNIAKIFGELITLIEDTKRIGNADETTVTLPCSSDNDDEIELFGVPNNLYIIGTMNTADRSIALLDTALRRRFDFIEMMPQPYHSLISKDVVGVNCQELLKVMNQRISVLLDREHQIGHSYFINVDSMKKLSHAFRNKIMPLLQEYFYDDWERIVLVLNNNKFVTKREIKDGLFKGTDLVDAEHLIYALIEAKSEEWTKSENYQKIYKTTKQTQADENDGN